MGNRLGEGGQLVVGCRPLDRSGQQLNSLPLRWAAGRRFGLARLSIKNGLGCHRQSSINENMDEYIRQLFFQTESGRGFQGRLVWWGFSAAGLRP
jgi:hypothetical protein